MSNTKDKLIQKIKENKKIFYIVKCLKNINNISCVDDVINLHNSPFIINMDSFGEKNKDKIIYYLDSGDNVSGFFAEYRKWLESFCFADRYGFQPVVKIDKKSFYAEQEIIFGTNNPFEYYFEQPSNISVEDAKESFNVVVFREKHRKLSNTEYNHSGYNYLEYNHLGYNINDSYINNMAYINRKYIRLNKRVEKELKLQIDEKLMNKRTIGVHIRGTDFKVGFDKHPKIVSPKQFLKNTVEIFDKYNYEQVFLATDEAGVIDLFYEEFKDKLVYYTNVERSSGIQSVVFSENIRKNHHYQLGYEVLRDMHTLSACDALIAGLSNVSMCARIQKRSNSDSDYEYLNIINNGINSCAKIAEKDIKKMKEKMKIN